MKICTMVAPAVACLCGALAASCGPDVTLVSSGATSTASSASGDTAGSGTGTGGGSASVTGAGGGTGTGGGSTSVTGAGGGTCASSHHEGNRTPLELYIMLDKSGSMNTSDKWMNCTNALKLFVQSPEVAGIGVGIHYFPIAGAIPPACQGCTDCACVFNCGCGGCSCSSGLCTCTGTVDSCQTADYATPAVEIGLLPGNATPIINSINSILPEGATPTRPALEGALTHARDWAIESQPQGCRRIRDRRRAEHQPVRAEHHC